MRGPEPPLQLRQANPQFALCLVEALQTGQARSAHDPRLPDGHLTEKQAKSVRQSLALERKAATAKQTQPCPESPHDLWAQKVSVRQAATMLGQTEAEVAQLWEQFDSERETLITSGQLADATTQAIRELKGRGQTVAQIAETLRLHRGLDLRTPEGKVAEALRSPQVGSA